MPLVAPNQQRLPAAGGLSAREATFSAAAEPLNHLFLSFRVLRSPACTVGKTRMCIFPQPRNPGVKSGQSPSTRRGARETQQGGPKWSKNAGEYPEIQLKMTCLPISQNCPKPAKILMPFCPLLYPYEIHFRIPLRKESFRLRKSVLFPPRPIPSIPPNPDPTARSELRPPRRCRSQTHRTASHLD